MFYPKRNLVVKFTIIFLFNPKATQSCFNSKSVLNSKSVPQREIKHENSPKITLVGISW